MRQIFWVRGVYLLLTLNCFFSGCSQYDDNPPYPLVHPFEKKQLIGHAGDCSNAPGNTMPSFEYAVNVLGLQWIECDPCVTKDGVIVLNHGKTIDDHSNGTGYISEMTYDSLCLIDFGNPQKFGEKYKGTKICTAKEIVEFAKKHNVIIEFDFSHFDATPEKVKQLYDIVVENNYLEYTVFDPLDIRELSMISELTTDVAILYFTLDATLDIPEELFKFKNVFIDLSLYKIGDRVDIPERIHNLGFKAVTELINPVPTDPVEAIELFEKMMQDMEMKNPKSVNREELKVLTSSVNPIRLKNNPVVLDDLIIAEIYSRIIK